MREAYSANRINTELQIIQVVQGIKNSEDVHSVLYSQVAELVDDVVRVRCISNSVGTPQQHLKGDVGDELTKLG